MCTKRKPAVASNMKIISICVIIFITVHATTNATEKPAVVFQRNNDNFTSRFMTEVLKVTHAKNLIMSAFSVLPPLAQLSMGGSGKTRHEIQDVINFHGEKQIRAAFTQAIESATEIAGVTLKLCNKIYVSEHFQLEKKFTTLARKIFKNEVEHVDFVRTEAAARTINLWIEKQTQGRIKKIIPASTLSKSTTLVLVNSIYFKGSWLTPFKPELTKDQPFFMSGTKSVMIPTMHTVNTFEYGEDKVLDAKLLLLDYDKRESGFLIVLPNKIEGLTGLLEKLKDPNVLQKAVADMTPAEVDVAMPKFRIESTIDLKNILMTMGVKTIFSNEANLKHLIIGKDDIFLGNAMQKGFILVNENGTEAAAANVIHETKSIKIPRKVLHANRPFYFEIRQDTTRLFTGVLGSFIARNNTHPNKHPPAAGNKTSIKRCNVMDFLQSLAEERGCALNFDIEV